MRVLLQRNTRDLPRIEELRDAGKAPVIQPIRPKKGEHATI
jgi:hypothetical protein